jgi:hypothetical protein
LLWANFTGLRLMVLFGCSKCTLPAFHSAEPDLFVKRAHGTAEGPSAYHRDNKRGYLRGIQRIWQHIRDETKLHEVRIHDLEWLRRFLSVSRWIWTRCNAIGTKRSRMCAVSRLREDKLAGEIVRDA